MAIKPTKKELKQLEESRKRDAEQKEADARQKREFNARKLASKKIANILREFTAVEIEGILKNATDTIPKYVALQAEYDRQRAEKEQRERWDRGEDDPTR